MTSYYHFEKKCKLNDIYEGICFIVRCEDVPKFEDMRKICFA